MIEGALTLNKSLMKLPYIDQDLTLTLDYNIWDIYVCMIKGQKPVLQKGNFVYRIDRSSLKWDCWEDWCREVVWYGKEGIYLQVP